MSNERNDLFAENEMGDTRTKIVLAFKGGGVKGIAYVGVMQALERHREHVRIVGMAGSSAGALTAVRVCCKPKKKEGEGSEEFLPSERLLAALTQPPLDKLIVGKISMVKNVLLRGYADPGERLRELIGEWTSEAEFQCPIGITFTSSENVPLVFFVSRNGDPNRKLTDALADITRASSGFPFFFGSVKAPKLTPELLGSEWRIAWGSHENKLALLPPEEMDDFNKDSKYLMDGGVLWNMPVPVAAELAAWKGGIMPPLEKGLIAGKVPSDAHIVAVDLVSHKQKDGETGAKKTSRPTTLDGLFALSMLILIYSASWAVPHSRDNWITSPLALIISLVVWTFIFVRHHAFVHVANTLINVWMNSSEKLGQSVENLISIDTADTDTMDFDLSQSQQEKLIKNGADATNAWLETLPAMAKPQAGPTAPSVSQSGSPITDMYRQGVEQGLVRRAFSVPWLFLDWAFSLLALIITKTLSLIAVFAALPIFLHLVWPSSSPLVMTSVAFCTFVVSVLLSIRMAIRSVKPPSLRVERGMLALWYALAMVDLCLVIAPFYWDSRPTQAVVVLFCAMVPFTHLLYWQWVLAKQREHLQQRPDRPSGHELLVSVRAISVGLTLGLAASLPNIAMAVFEVGSITLGRVLHCSASAEQYITLAAPVKAWVGRPRERTSPLDSDHYLATIEEDETPRVLHDVDPLNVSTEEFLIPGGVSILEGALAIVGEKNNSLFGGVPSTCKDEKYWAGYARMADACVQTIQNLVCVVGGKPHPKGSAQCAGRAQRLNPESDVKEMCDPFMAASRVGLELTPDQDHRRCWRLPTEAEWETVARGLVTKTGIKSGETDLSHDPISKWWPDCLRWFDGAYIIDPRTRNLSGGTHWGVGSRANYCSSLFRNPVFAYLADQSDCDQDGLIRTRSFSAMGPWYNIMGGYHEVTSTIYMARHPESAYHQSGEMLVGGAVNLVTKGGSWQSRAATLRIEDRVARGALEDTTGGLSVRLVRNAN